MNGGVKEMLTKILAWGAGILGFMVLLLRGQLKDAKIKDLQRDAGANKVAEKASEALVKGVLDESKPVSRGYFDSK